MLRNICPVAAPFAWNLNYLDTRSLRFSATLESHTKQPSDEKKNDPVPYGEGTGCLPARGYNLLFGSDRLPLRMQMHLKMKGKCCNLWGLVLAFF